MEVTINGAKSKAGDLFTGGIGPAGLWIGFSCNEPTAATHNKYELTAITHLGPFGHVAGMAAYAEARQLIDIAYLAGSDN